MRSLVEVVLGVVDWGRQRTGAVGAGDVVPTALGGLIAADTDEDALRSYWELDNRVVVQGQLFEAAVALIPALLAGLLANLKEPARYWLMELMMQIADGESHSSERDPNLGDAARSGLMEGLWVIYAQMEQDSPRVRATAVDLVARLDPQRERASAIVQAQLAEDPSEEVRRAVARLER